MNKKILVIAAAVLVIGGGAAAFFLAPHILPAAIRPSESANAQGVKAEKNKVAHEVEADLDVFVVNLVGDGAARYLRTTLSLGVGSEHEKEEVKKFNGVIRHAVIMYLTEKRVDDLLSIEGKGRVRADLQKAVNAAVGKKLVSSVYFKEFLIQ